jgi:hypothetical protein
MWLIPMIVDVLGLAGGIALLSTRAWLVGLLVIAYAGWDLIEDLFHQQAKPNFVSTVAEVLRDAFLPFKELNEAANGEEARLIRWNNNDREAGRELLTLWIVLLICGAGLAWALMSK